MAILKIARMGHPILNRRADPVTDIAAPGIQLLIADMAETMADAAGMGLAAPQVHASLRIVLFHVPASRAGGEEGDRAVAPTVLINPVIEPLGDERITGFEACLSVPGLTGAVARFARIRYRGLDATGRPIDREAAGFHARVVQHECDHLDGILYPMRMEDLATLCFTSEMRHRMTRDATEKGAADAAEDGDGEARADVAEEAQ